VSWRRCATSPQALREAWQAAVEQHGPKPTAAQVREVVSPLTRGQLSNQQGGTDEWETPQDLFDLLDGEFGFDLDVCALESSAKCDRYFTPADDGLAHDWRGTCWMNPPYGDEIPKWIQKAYHSSLRGATVVCLVPARVDTGWWWDYCRYGEIRFLRGRLRFGTASASAPFPSAVVVFGPGREACVRWWEWR
jgi:phage N-6-adenine-methyltransferase